MRASCGCLVEDGMVLHGFDGPCAARADEPQRPTDEDYCAANDHGYYGDEWAAPSSEHPHFDEVVATGGRCYCGIKRYPIGGGVR
ncbi:hypothetical protein PO878_04090 [Iamia majanohamensis]|uniref:Uncharacterized protein n=1 Tax=Iamia majanohamensis TaxID=467976 RepID=A0AAE9YB76_9ACTN|nr:hypothetical protein [Iamia majanohamensis]WCO67903.1 hypothetical protein PO878_04090 [Iamia majanohamensis]